MPDDSGSTERWRYVVLVAKFVAQVFQPGLTKAMSVLIPSMVFQLDLSYSTVGLLVSLQIGLCYLASPLSNYVSAKFGVRLVLTISGFLSGLSLMGAFFSQSSLSLGCSFFFAGLFSSPLRQCSTVVLHEHFGDMFGTVFTFSHMGGLAGGILLPYVTVVCLEAYGMRGTLLCLSGISFFQAACGAAMRRPRHRNTIKNKDKHGKTDDAKRNSSGEYSQIPLRNMSTCEDDDTPEIQELSTEEVHSEKETQRSRSIWNGIRDFISSILFIDLLKKERVFTFLFVPCQILGEISLAVWITFCVPYGISVGLTEKNAAYLVMAGSVGGFVGRMILIAVLYKYPRLSPHMYSFYLAVSAIGLFSYLVKSSLVHLLICSFFVGLGLFSAFSAFYSALAIKVEQVNFAAAVALASLIYGGMFLTSGTLAGFLYEIFGSFGTIFLITGFCVTIPCLAFSTYIYFDHRQQRHNSSKQN